MSQQHSKGERVHPGTGIEHVPQWFGIYLGKVTHTRKQDLWIRVNVPQLLGDREISNWARPAAFNSVGAIAPPTSAYRVVPDPVNISNGPPGDKGWVDNKPLGWGGFQKDPGKINLTPTDQVDRPDDWPDGRGRPTGFGDERGPGPPVGTLVLVGFIGGDINEPFYMLTSQKAA